MAVEIEYGHLEELKGVERINVWTEKDPSLRAEIERRLLAAIPKLTIVQSEAEAQVVFAVRRRAAKEDSPNPNLRYVTTGSVARGLDGGHVRLITDVVSTKENLLEAATEVTDAFANLLKSQNLKRYGAPDKSFKQDKKQFRSFAGLRPGMSKQEVLSAVGPPSRIERKGTTMPVWFYETTDGTFRLVFQIDALMNAELIGSKSKPK